MKILFAIRIADRKFNPCFGWNDPEPSGKYGFTEKSVDFPRYDEINHRYY
jgi:hypothetical protein